MTWLDSLRDRYDKVGKGTIKRENLETVRGGDVWEYLQSLDGPTDDELAAIEAEEQDNG